MKSSTNSQLEPDSVTLFSGGALLLQILGLVATYYFSKKAKEAQEQAEKSAHTANQIAEKSNLLALGVEDAAIYTRISQARKEVLEVSQRRDDILNGRRVEELCDGDKRRLGAAVDLYLVSLENYLNTYSVACGQYLDNKVDKSRFKKNHSTAIRNIIESKDPVYRERLDPESASPYKPLWMVYKEFHNLEE